MQQRARCGMRDGGCGMRDAGCTMWDAGCGIQDAAYRMRDAGWEMRDVGYRMRDAGYDAAPCHRSRDRHPRPSMTRRSGCPGQRPPRDPSRNRNSTFTSGAPRPRAPSWSLAGAITGDFDKAAVWGPHLGRDNPKHQRRLGVICGEGSGG